MRSASPSLAVLLVALLMTPGCQAGSGPQDHFSGDRGADGLPTSVRLRVAGKAQRRSLSCESRSAVDLLRRHGIEVTEANFVAALPRSDNPHVGFVGDIDGPGEQLPPAGYGVYARPIARLLETYGLPTAARQGLTPSALRRELAAGRPVIVWATSSLAPTVAVILRDVRGQPFRAVRGEHTFLAIGYAPGAFILLDPATGKSKRVAAARFDAAWAPLGRMAVTTTP